MPCLQGGWNPYFQEEGSKTGKPMWCDTASCLHELRNNSINNLLQLEYLIEDKKFFNGVFGTRIRIKIKNLWNRSMNKNTH